MAKNAIIIFAKEPIEGQVKTRLASSIGDQKAVEVYKEFCSKIQQETFDWLTQYTESKFFNNPANPYALDQVLGWSCPKEQLVDKKPAILKSLFPFYHLLEQIGYDLGQRMFNVLHEYSKQGFEHIIIRGTDSPDLPIEYIEEGFEELQNNQVVIGPTEDGGYYCIGINTTLIEIATVEKLFQNISWSTESVFNETKSIADNNSLSLKVLPRWYDIDEDEDYKRYLSGKIN